MAAAAAATATSVVLALAFTSATWAQDTDAGAAYRETHALLFAAGEGDAAAVAALLAGGADVNQRSTDGETPLHVAGIRGNPAVVAHLLEHGAEVDARTPKGQTLHMTPLMWAAFGGHAEMVELLVAHGADPAAADESGLTVVEMAARAGHQEVERVVREALEKRANARDGEL